MKKRLYSTCTLCSIYKECKKSKAFQDACRDYTVKVGHEEEAEIFHNTKLRANSGCY